MTNSQNESIRLQDLKFIASETQDEQADALIEQERQEVGREFAQTKEKVEEYLVKIFPKAIDLICSLNGAISRKGKRLFFKNEEVQSIALTYDNCHKVCKEVLLSFPNTLNAIVAAIKSRAGVAYVEEISQKFCREFNTLIAFEMNAEQLQNEVMAHRSAPISKVAEKEDYDNFSEVITIPMGKTSSQEISIEFNIRRTDAHAVVAGMSGSGKSSLLQSLILGGAYKYSPDELQFWLLDFKDGTGLIQFKDLKHVRVMAVKNRPIDATEIMDYIEKEYTRRADLITKSGGGNICDYNRRAKAENKPLMPRLLIIIDEFTVMYRPCFAVLNNIARLGRSLGMGFILSSQIIETGAAYSDAVQQANHLFEFKNSDSAFGRLVKNVTEAEKKFVDSEVPGTCIYRRGNARTSFRIVFAGELEEQSAFVQTINDKWSDYSYGEPIIAGLPERIVKNPAELSADGQKIKECFKREKKVLIPIGESRMGEPYLYKIDRANQTLLAFGDETRVASVEYSIIEHFKHLSETEKAVYYIDLNCNPDREKNAVTAKYGEDIVDGVRYIDTDSGAKKVIDRIYNILKTRRESARADRSKDIGNPIELIIHNAERISELKDEKRAPKMGTLTRNRNLQTSFPADTELSDRIAASKQRAVEDVKEEAEDIGTLKKLREIMENGRDSRIYVMLYFEEKSRFQALANELFTYNYDFKDVLVIPSIPDLHEELSYSEVIDSLSACRLRELASAFNQTNDQTKNASLEQSDFVCAVLVDDKVPHKIIPYEWTAEEN